MNTIYEDPSRAVDEGRSVHARCLIQVFFRSDCWKAPSRGVSTNNATQKCKDSTNLKVRILQINREFKQRRRRSEISK